MDDNTDKIIDLIQSIYDSRTLSSKDWDEFTIIMSFDEFGDFAGNYGYYYSGSSIEPFSVGIPHIKEAAENYERSLRPAGDKPMEKILFQFNQKSKKFHADFEFENASRWKVTPDNIDTIVEELRPNLGSPE